MTQTTYHPNQLQGRPQLRNAHNLYSFQYDMAGRGFDNDNLILSDLPSIQSDKEYTDIHSIADSFANVSLKCSNGIFKSDWKLEQVKHKVHENKSGQATAEIDGEVKVYIPTGEVGFSSLPSQLYRRSLKKGFDFLTWWMEQSRDLIVYVLF